MNLLPFEKIEYRSTLNSKEVMNRLSKLVDQDKKRSLFSIMDVGGKPYIGRLSPSSFEIERDISYRNSFLPKITGQLHSTEKETIIIISMRPRNFPLIFITFWMGLISLICMGELMALVLGVDWNAAMLIPFAMLLGAYLMLMGPFKYETNKSRKDLSKVFGVVADNFSIA